MACEIKKFKPFISFHPVYLKAQPLQVPARSTHTPKVSLSISAFLLTPLSRRSKQWRRQRIPLPAYRGDVRLPPRPAAFWRTSGMVIRITSWLPTCWSITSILWSPQACASAHAWAHTRTGRSQRTMTMGEQPSPTPTSPYFHFLRTSTNCMVTPGVSTRSSLLFTRMKKLRTHDSDHELAGHPRQMYWSVVFN